ncbi:unnamed protein product [Phyllotreta striolata]|uniref:C-type lectin domain-containing protein n=1 Tax=Phyllotreta striolata TaxID=444603 RepID=A0A9N9TUW6_PHYSR|nr:unnamed protein product [Phyllotreta striolata]
MLWFRLYCFCAIFALFCFNQISTHFIGTKNKTKKLVRRSIGDDGTLTDQNRPHLNLISNGNKSYHFQNIFKVDFLESYQFCKSNNMELLHIESEDENKFLSKKFYELDKKFHFSDEFYWTSGTRTLRKNITWMWLSTGELFSYTNWKPGQPNNSTQKCMAINASYSKNKKTIEYQWSDINCTSNHFFVCEFTDTKNYTKTP